MRIGFRAPRSRPHGRWYIGFALAALVAGCGDGPGLRATSDAGHVDGPVPTLAWRVTVQESDSVHLAQPAEFTVDPDDGSFFITDRFSGRVANVDRDGRITRFFGRKGRGPGEFTQASLMFPRGRDLMVDDVASRTFSVFDRRTAEYRGQRRHEGILNHVHLVGDTAWLGMQDIVKGTAVARWNLASDSLTYMVPLPREYRESQPLAGIYNGVFVVPWADTLLVALQGSDEVYLHATDGRALDTVDIPAARRRGVPDDVVKRFESIPFPEMFSAASMVFAAGRLTSGGTGIVHFDQQIQGRSITAEAFVSVLSPDRQRACVDGAVPVSTDAQPRVLFRGDTLIVLNQRLTADDRAETTLSGYVLDTRRCRWRRTE